MDAAARNRWLELREWYDLCCERADLPLTRVPKQVRWDAFYAFFISELNERLEAVADALKGIEDPPDFDLVHNTLFLSEMSTGLEWAVATAGVNESDIQGVHPASFNGECPPISETAAIRSFEQMAERIGQWDSNEFIRSVLIYLPESVNVELLTRAADAYQAFSIACRFVASTRIDTPVNAADGDGTHAAAGDSPIARTKPHWNPERSELSFEGEIVRKIKPTAHACKILSTFEDDGWPDRIDDPLSGPALSPTVRTLNAGLTKLRFVLDGTGEGVLWEVSHK